MSAKIATGVSIRNPVLQEIAKVNRVYKELADIMQEARRINQRMAILEAELKRQKAWEAMSGRRWK